MEEFMDVNPKEWMYELHNKITEIITQHKSTNFTEEDRIAIKDWIENNFEDDFNKFIYHQIDKH